MGDLIFELLELSFLLLVLVSRALPLAPTSMSLAALLVLARFLLVRLICIGSRVWFGYVLFLVYVGGLLVLFIYVCMVRRNYSFGENLGHFFSFLRLAILIASFTPLGPSKNFLGLRAYSSGAWLVAPELFSFFVRLVLILLVVFLGVVRIVVGTRALIVATNK